MSPTVERISIAILSWNGRVHLETCLAALADQTDPGVPWETLVLDNGSSDGTAEWLARHYPKVRCLRSDVNLGFCAGNNRLVDEARGDAVAMLNNDTRPRRDWLANLTRALRQAPPDVAAVSGLIVDWSGDRLDFARGLMTFDAHALQEGFRRPLERLSLPAEGSELLFGCGGNMLVRRSSFLASGGFDPDYFAYYEDVDLGWRLWQGGERILFAPAAVVEHRSSATSDLLGLYNRGFLFERNAWLTAYKNYETGWWEKLMPAILLTLASRTQTLLEENNAGGDLLRLDPYAGLIADTARNEAAPARRSLADRWRLHGTRDLVRRAAWRARRILAGYDHAPRLTDERTVAQLRVQAYLLRHLDQAAGKRQRVQARRRRADREIFERFPLVLVPTYPGDQALFSSPGFRSWLPADLPLRECRLEDLVDFG